MQTTPPPRLPVRDKAAARDRGWGGVSPMLTRLAAERATGVLVRERGTLHLAAGRVVHADSPSAPGLDILLTARGTLDAGVWRQALAETGDRHRAGHLLVDGGLLAPGTLEVCRLVALYDAAYFALAPSSTPGRFRYATEYGTEGATEHDVQHHARHAAESESEADPEPTNGPLTRPMTDPTTDPMTGPTTELMAGPMVGPAPDCGCPVPVAALERETLRRRDLLHRIWPDPTTDEAPLTRAHRAAPPAPTARQRAVLAELDDVRTATDIARELGRPAFHTLVDIRRLAAAGVVSPRLPPPTPPAPPAPYTPPAPPNAPHAHVPDPLEGIPAGVIDPHITLLKRLRDALEAL